MHVHHCDCAHAGRGQALEPACVLTASCRLHQLSHQACLAGLELALLSCLRCCLTTVQVTALPWTLLCLPLMLRW